MKKIICIHAIVHGKVQGVFYRFHTAEQANALGLSGWVKNNANETVELQACGESEKIQVLLNWLKQGPARAVVSKVDWREIPAEHHDEFIILR